MTNQSRMAIALIVLAAFLVILLIYLLLPIFFSLAESGGFDLSTFH